jgi:hypothetical protein
MNIQTQSYCQECKRKGKNNFLCERVYFQALDSNKPYASYIKITAKFIATNKPVRWKLVSDGFVCPKCKAKKPSFFSARGRKKVTDKKLIERLRYSSYVVSEQEPIRLYEYHIDWTKPKDVRTKRAVIEKKFSGILWTTTPRIQASDEILQKIERKFLDHNFILVSKEMKGIHFKDTIFLVCVNDFRKLKRREVSMPIVIE